MILDGNGIEILATDAVMVTSWGYDARVIDTGCKSAVIRLARTRVVIIDADGRERPVRPCQLSVLRRDGAPGFEHNRGMNHPTERL